MDFVYKEDSDERPMMTDPFVMQPISENTDLTDAGLTDKSKSKNAKKRAKKR